MAATQPMCRATLKYIKYNLKIRPATRAELKIFNNFLRKRVYGALLSLKFDLNETVQYRYAIVSKQIIFYEVTQKTR